MGRLDGRVAIVTGGAMGIGRAIAEALAAEGARIVVADLEGAEEAAAALPTEALGLRVDVSSEEDAAAMAAAAIDRFGRIDALVNNAGIYTSLVPKPFEEIDPAEWRSVMDVERPRHVPLLPRRDAADEGAGRGADRQHRLRHAVQGRPVPACTTSSRRARWWR